MDPMPTLLALAFRMPSDDALIGIALLWLVLIAVAVIVWTILPKPVPEPWSLVYRVACGLIAIVLLLRTFTTWGG